VSPAKLNQNILRSRIVDVALSAMRLASHYRTRDAVKRFSQIQLGKIGREGEADVAPSNFSKLAEKARRLFAEISPFNENAANSLKFSERQRVAKR